MVSLCFLVYTNNWCTATSATKIVATILVWTYDEGWSACCFIFVHLMVSGQVKLQNSEAFSKWIHNIAGIYLCAHVAAECDTRLEFIAGFWQNVFQAPSTPMGAPQVSRIMTPSPLLKERYCLWGWSLGTQAGIIFNLYILIYA